MACKRMVDQVVARLNLSDRIAEFLMVVVVDLVSLVELESQTLLLRDLNYIGHL